MNHITVLGHINPDTDTICSAIAYAWYLNTVANMPATAVAPGVITKETEYVLGRFSIAHPQRIESVTEHDSLIIVDTNNPEELITGWDKASVLQIIDHHKLMGGISSSEPIQVIILPVACTATIIYGLMTQNGHVIIPTDIAGILLACIISDTLKFTSPTTTEQDKEVARALSAIADVEIDDLARDMFAAKSDLTGVSPTDILTMDSKVTAVGDKKIRISVLESTAPANALAMRDQLITAIRTLKHAEGLHAAFLFIVDIVTSTSELIAADDIERELAAKAFNVPATGDTITLPGIVSRKKQMLPPIEAALS